MLQSLKGIAFVAEQPLLILGRQRWRNHLDCDAFSGAPVAGVIHILPGGLAHAFRYLVVADLFQGCRFFVA